MLLVYGDEAEVAAGSISGGCLENDLLQSAWERTEEGPALVTYDSTSEDDIVWGFGLGCNGIVKVLLERLPEDGGPIGFIKQVVETRRPGMIETIIEEGPNLGEHRYGFGLDTQYARAGVFAEVVRPPRRLVLFGSGHDALPLLRAGKSLGWHVAVLDHRDSPKSRFREANEFVRASPDAPLSGVALDEESALVIMSHNYLADLAAFRHALESSAGYIGLLGPYARSQKMIEELDAQDAARHSRVHAPIGLDIGAEGPDEIALAIVSEIQAFFAGRSGSSLSGRKEALHG